MSNLNLVLQNLDDIEKKGKINVYALKNIHKPEKDSYAIALPSNQNSYFLKEYCKFLNSFVTFSCVKYDAINYKDGTYEYIDLSAVEGVWDKFEDLLKDESLNRNNYASLVSGINLTICELHIDDEIYFLGTWQEKSESKFKGRFPFLAEEGKLTSIPCDKLLTLTFNVDFVVSKKASIIYIFNRKHFQKVFNYYEILKNHVVENISVIDDWTFIDNVDFIKGEIDTSYVYKSLSKVIDDSNYLKIIKTTKPRTLKKRLLEKSSGAFTEDDFKNDKLQINKSNLEKIIKMIAKGFKYNFFTDKAED